MKKIILSIITILIINTCLYSQEKETMLLSLENCVKMAVDNNINIQSANIDAEKARYKVNETRSTLLPKITGSGNFQDHIKLQTTMLPGELIGQPGTSLAVQMGSNFVTSASVGINQVLYNQTALSALRLSKMSYELSSLSVEKASEEIATEITKLYFLTTTTIEQKKLIEDNIARTQQMENITRLFVENSIGKQVDYDRIHVSLENLYTQLSNTEAAIEQQLNMIKYMLGIPLYQSIVLTENSEMSLLKEEPGVNPDFSSHIDILLLESQIGIYEMNEKMIKHGYVPSIVFTGQMTTQGLRNDFKNYFNSNPENKWYGSSYIGLSLSIPIFDGLEKRSKTQQAKLDYEKANMKLDDKKEQLNADHINALNNYQNNRTNVVRQKANISLAEKVYAETSLKYREGLATMSDLLQDEMSLSSAQSSYLNALYNLKEAELKIMSLNGEINKLIK
jgi:outer membrane protein TolC